MYDAVTGRDAGIFPVKLRLVERVGYRAYEFGYRVRRGVSVAVESDDVLCTLKSFAVAGRDYEFTFFAAQHCRQRKHRTPLAFKAAKAVPACILGPRSGKKIKAAAIFFV